MDRTFSAPEPTPPDALWPTPAAEGPVIVRKRSRLAGLALQSQAQPGPAADEAPRGPRVFTVRAAPPAATAPAGEGPADTAAPKPRRRRDAAHRPGEVTRIVIEPPIQEAAVAAPPAAPAPAPEGSAFGDVNAQLDALMSDVKRHAYFAHLKFF